MVDTFLSIFNIASLVVFVVLVTLAGARMIWRYGNFAFYGQKVPVLLKRDIALFLALGTYFGTALVALVIGSSGLAHEPLWVVPRGLMVLAAQFYWTWVEYHLEDGTKKPPKEDGHE